MNARYAFRKRQLLEECQVALRFSSKSSASLHLYGALCQNLPGSGRRATRPTYVCGLLSDVKRKNIESIAYRFGQSRLPLQGFLGWDEWDDDPCDMS